MIVSPSPQQRVVFLAVESMLGSSATFSRYGGPAGASDLYVAVFNDVPSEGYVSYATLGLSEHPIIHDGKELTVRVELVALTAGQSTEVQDCLANTVLNIRSNSWVPLPDAVIPHAVEQCVPGSTLHHLLLVDPFSWGGTLTSTETPNGPLAWLQAIPIAESELRYAVENSLDDLKRIFEERDVDVADFGRASVV